jgi:hypothetical protein
MQQEPTFNFGLTKIFFLYLPHTQSAAKNQKLSKSGVKRLNFFYIFLISKSHTQMDTQMGLVCAKNASKKFSRLVYRTSGVIFFIDYCTAIRDT